MRLTKTERKVVEEAIVEEAVRWGQCVHAISVCSNHVHIVLGYNGRELSRSVRRYKNAAYFALRKSGRHERVWTKGYDKRYCFNKEALEKRINYVRAHNKG